MTFLASATGGEAMMVESLEGEGTHKKMLGLLARSMLRAASRMTLRIAGGRLLAVRADAAAADEAAAAAEGVGRRAHDRRDHFGRTRRRRRCGVHTRGAADGEALPVDRPPGGPPAGSSAATRCRGPPPLRHARVGDGTHSDASAPPPAAALSVLEKLRRGGRAALRRLPLLEPAYAPPKSTSYPDETAAARTAACLAISLKGQLVAPSVTKASPSPRSRPRSIQCPSTAAPSRRRSARHTSRSANSKTTGRRRR